MRTNRIRFAKVAATILIRQRACRVTSKIIATNAGLIIRCHTVLMVAQWIICARVLLAKLTAATNRMSRQSIATHTRLGIRCHAVLMVAQRLCLARALMAIETITRSAQGIRKIATKTRRRIDRLAVLVHAQWKILTFVIKTVLVRATKRIVSATQTSRRILHQASRVTAGIRIRANSRSVSVKVI